MLAIPAILGVEAPAQILAKQWAHLFQHGKMVGPVIALTATLGYAYLAWDLRAQGRDWMGYLLAGGLTMGLVPFTLVFLNPTNARLLDIAAGTSAAAKATGNEAIRGTIAKWSGLNLVRAFFPLAGSVVGFWTLLA